MEWYVQYRKDTVDHIVRHPTPEQAIEAACLLMDDGCDVYAIGTGPLGDSIAIDQRGGRVRLNSVSVPIDGFPAVGLH